MNAVAHIEPKQYTIKQLIRYTGYSESKLRRILKSGKLKSHLDGKRYVLKADIDAYIDAKTEQATAPVQA